MRGVWFEGAGKRAWLYFSGRALFDLPEELGAEDLQAAHARLLEPGVAGWSDMCTAAQCLSRWGRAAMVCAGLPAPDELEAGQLLMLCSAREMTLLRQAVLEAIHRGLRQDVPADEDDEIDEGLAELEKKKGTG